MTFDDLPVVWGKANAHAAPPGTHAQLATQASRGVERLWATILRRDIIETLAAFFVVYAFSWLFFNYDPPLAKIGAATVVFGAMQIIFKLHRTRADWTRSPLDAPIHEFCVTEIGRIDRQVALHRSILWWYIAPSMIGVNLFFFGLKGWSFDSLFYLAFTLLLGWWIYAKNQAVVGDRLLPLRAELSGLLEELEEAA